MSESFNGSFVYILFEPSTSVEKREEAEMKIKATGATLVSAADDTRLRGQRNGIFLYGFPECRPVVVKASTIPRSDVNALVHYGLYWMDGRVVQLTRGPAIRHWTWALALLAGRDPLVAHRPVMISVNEAETQVMTVKWALITKKAVDRERELARTIAAADESPRARTKTPHKSAPKRRRSPSPSTSPSPDRKRRDQPAREQRRAHDQKASTRKSRDKASDEVEAGPSQPEGRKAKAAAADIVPPGGESVGKGSSSRQADKDESATSAEKKKERLFGPGASDDELDGEADDSILKYAEVFVDMPPARADGTAEAGGTEVGGDGSGVDEAPAEPTVPTPSLDELLEQVTSAHLEALAGFIPHPFKMEERPFLVPGGYEEESIYLGVGVSPSDALLLISHAYTDAIISPSTIVIVPVPPKTMVTARQHRLYVDILAMGGCKAVLSYE